MKRFHFLWLFLFLFSLAACATQQGGKNLQLKTCAGTYPVVVGQPKGPAAAIYALYPFNANMRAAGAPG